MEQTLWYLIAGTRGGETRARIITSLAQKPANANQLSKQLSLDYKTVTHHLGILVENRVLTVVNRGGYGAAYFISDHLKTNPSLLGEIMAQFGKKKKKPLRPQ